MSQRLIRLCLAVLVSLSVIGVDSSPVFSASNNWQYQQQEMLRQQQASQKARETQEAASRAREQQLRQQQQHQQQLRQQEAARRAQEEARRTQQQRQLQQKQSQDQIAKQQQAGQQQDLKKRADQQRIKQQADQRRKKQEADRKKALTDHQLQAIRQLQQTRRVETEHQVTAQGQKTNEASINKDRLDAKAAHDNRINEGGVKGNGGGQPPKQDLSKTFNKQAPQKGGAAAEPVKLSKEQQAKLATLTKLPKDSQVTKEGPALPDSAWHKNAPHQVTPGTSSITHQKYNPKTKQLETSRVEYDQYGRQVKRTDHTDHGYGEISKPKEYHSNPHTHTYEYGPEYGPKGKETRSNQ